MLRQWLFALVLALSSFPVQAEVRLSVAYSDSADLFSLMDNVSGWLDGFVIPEYRAEWVARFGWLPEDQLWADRYREYRNRTFVDSSQDLDPATSPDGLFAARSSNTAAGDPLATHFLSQPSAGAALATLGTIATPADAKMLGGFYRHFASKWRVLLQESATLAAKADRLNAQLNATAVNAFVDRVSRFYGVTVDGTFHLFFTRRPPGPADSAEVVAGENMLLHAPTAADTGDADWDTIVMHELVHYISARQPSVQKQALTNRFLARCPLPVSSRRLWMVEEPLAVAWGQAAYSAHVRGRPLDPAENWYGTPWIDVVARTLAATAIRAYGDDTTINDGIVDEAADRCRDLVAVAARLNAPPPAP